MARARNIKPGFFLNEYLGTCDPYEALLFEGLWMLADRNGILENRPLKIKAQIFPYRENMNAPEITGAIRNLSSNGFLGLYTAEGVDYIVIFNFHKHQNPHKNEKSAGYPEPPENIAIKESSGNYSKAPVIDGTARADSLFSESPLLIPESPLSDSGSLNPEPPIGCGGGDPPPPDDSSPKPGKAKGETTPVWDAYSAAYQDRYGTSPVRNAKINGQLAQFIKRIPADEAPAVAAFYVGHNNSWYVQKGHSVDALLKDAESLRTQWATRRQVTTVGARQAERTSHNAGVVRDYLEQEGRNSG